MFACSLEVVHYFEVTYTLYNGVHLQYIVLNFCSRSTDSAELDYFV